MADKKYYWLRLRKDFFKRHDVRILEAMPNGKEYALFYLKLLTESIDHEGALRFSDKIPYTIEMLSTVTNTAPDVVKAALEALIELEMIEHHEDGTYIIHGIENMIGTAENDEFTRESARLRAKAYRDRKKNASRDDNVTVTLQSRDDNVIRHGEIEIEKEIKKEYRKKEPGKPGTRSRSMIHQQYEQRDIDFDSIEADFLGKKETEHGKHNKNSGEND